MYVHIFHSSTPLRLRSGQAIQSDRHAEPSDAAQDTLCRSIVFMQLILFRYLLKYDRYPTRKVLKNENQITSRFYPHPQPLSQRARGTKMHELINPHYLEAIEWRLSLSPHQKVSK